MTDKHKIVLQFTTGSTKTAISCKCGNSCGKVVTGTKIPEILEIYRKHIQEEENAQ